MKMKKATAILLVLLIVAAAAGCKAQRPVLYPNAHLESVGSAAAQADIDDCIAQATAAGAGPDQGGSAGNVATAAAVAGAAGAVFGAIMGDGDVARRAAASAGAGAAGAAVVEGTKSGKPDSIHKNFVNKCLSKKGYEIVGWK